ncbi:partitioning defective protein 6-like [Dendronephthya gigantea]|uniref:partitioning defective protein 6-like n=1 Tax=Dendronephthya gigantea TaxID=151771 RepID=UPI00106AFE1D|nr:partitioning defective protein 6-like [Dendronephthya gigantea]
MSSKKQGNLQRMFTQPDLSKIELKSKFDAEFRRVSIERSQYTEFSDFYTFVERLHHLEKIPFTLWYTDPDRELLPINNNNNLGAALQHANQRLRLVLQRQGESYDNDNTYVPPVVGSPKKRNILSNVTNVVVNRPKLAHRLAISTPSDFRRVSAIVDVDIVPETHRRVRLLKHNSDKPLGFYIRDGTSLRVTPTGMEKVPGIFISRLVPGGLAESTGLLAVNDEVLEVNGIEVSGKTLDQVTDMMIANSHNLIITVKPVSQPVATPRSMSQGRMGYKDMNMVKSNPDISRTRLTDNRTFSTPNLPMSLQLDGTDTYSRKPKRPTSVGTPSGMFIGSGNGLINPACEMFDDSGDEGEGGW